MGHIRIRLTTSRTGRPWTIPFLIYDTADELRAAITAYNGDQDVADTVGCVQARSDEQGRAVSLIVRLCRDRLWTSVIVHEVNHVVTAIYGADLGKTIRTGEHLTWHNETLAHLQSDLTAKLVNRLYALDLIDHA